MELVLASASPRREELLRKAGFVFRVRPSDVQEARFEGEGPEEFVERVAREKALQVASCFQSPSLVLGADTVVVVGAEVLPKPSDAQNARRMLRLLSGRTHKVITGVCLVRTPDRLEAVKHQTTLVGFRALDEKEIEEYIQSGEPFDKAGAYAIQGLASKFVTHIEGCYSNVVGLPVALVCQMIRDAEAR